MDRQELLKLSKSDLVDIILDRGYLKTDQNKSVPYLGNPIASYFAEVLQEFRFPIIITDSNIEKPGPIIVFANKGFCEMSGYKLEELVGKSPRILQGEKTDPKVLSALKDNLKNNNHFRGTTVNYRKDGSKFYNSWGIEPIKNIKGEITHFISIHSDLTKLKKYEKQLEKNNKELQKYIDQKNAFFSILAHDLKNPLTSFLTLTDLLSNNMNQLSIDKINTMTNQLFETANGLKELLNNLLIWARAEMRDIEKELTDLSLFDVIFGIKRLYNTKLSEKNIKIDNRIDNKTVIIADTFIVNTVLRNLIGNSLKFSESNSSVVVSFEEDENNYNIIVEDEGVGMSEKLINDVFAKDKRITNRGTNNEKGTGLGLKLCRELAELHDGNLQVESEVGKGSKFTLVLPKEK